MPDSAVVKALVARSARLASNFAQQRAEAEMLSRVTITRTIGKAGFDRATGKAAAAQTTEIYRGPAKIRKVTGGGSFELGDEPTTTGQTVISIPLSASTPMVRDEVSIDDDLDPQTVGRRFRVDDVQVSGIIQAERVLEVTGIEPSPNTVGL